MTLHFGFLPLCIFILGLNHVAESKTKLISQEIAQHLCDQRQEFVRTSVLQPPQKGRPPNAPQSKASNSCGWYKRQKECDEENPCFSFITRPCEKGKDVGVTKVEKPKIETPLEGGGVVVTAGKEPVKKVEIHPKFAKPIPEKKKVVPKAPVKVTSTSTSTSTSAPKSTSTSTVKPSQKKQNEKQKKKEEQVDAGEEFEELLRMEGKDIAPHEYPSIVLILNADENSTLCSGVIINETWVLTAAHCVVDLGETMIAISAGNHFERLTPGVPLQYAYVEEIALPPENNQDKPGGNISIDLALLKLEIPLQFNEQVNAAQLPHDLHDDGTFVLVGWGNFDENRDEAISYPLKKVKMPTVAEDICKDFLDKESLFVPLWKNAMCLIDERSYNGACFGDSGGPAFYLDAEKRPILVGIGSFLSKEKCADPDTVIVFTEVFYSLEWINKLVFGGAR